MAKKPPRRIGRYRILGELGRGAMGVVYRAEDTALERVVALKTIRLVEDMEGREDYQRRFLLEAKAAGKLTHPNIVTTYDFGEQDGVAYLAMELLEGTDLRSCLLEGSLSAVEAVDALAQVAEALGFAHERGVVHRDVKPGNIMLLERGTAKIMDFGVARLRTSDFKTSTGLVLGTPRFMSPEQISGAPVDGRSDIFSLGCVLYELLTREPLFAGEDPAQVAHNVTSLEPPPPSRVNPVVSSMLDFVVARALKKDPALRYQDAYEMASDLRACLSEVRERQAAAIRSAERRDETSTVRLEAGEREAPATAPADPGPPSGPRLAVSTRFDSAAALRRLGRPSKRDARRLSARPRRAGWFRRLRRDAARQRLAAGVLAGAVCALAIAWHL
ncbi:MAG TPA: protein kinase [Burkholderiales bacterium]|nr:protein kinase [Burkholderiales bacterium]